VAERHYSFRLATGEDMLPEDDHAETSGLRNPLRLRTQDDYKAALSKLELFLAKPPAHGTPAGIQFYALVEQIMAYEEKHFRLKQNQGMLRIH